MSLAAGLTNHFLAEGEPPPTVGLDAIGVPTLVVHGSDDPLFPVEHGRALAAAIPGARLVELAGVGHEQPPPRHWDVVVPGAAGPHPLRATRRSARVRW